MRLYPLEDKFWNTWLKSSSAVSIAVGGPFRGVREQALENLIYNDKNTGKAIRCR